MRRINIPPKKPKKKKYGKDNTAPRTRILRTRMDKN